MCVLLKCFSINIKYSGLLLLKYSYTTDQRYLKINISSKWKGAILCSLNISEFKIIWYSRVYYNERPLYIRTLCKCSVFSYLLSCTIQLDIDLLLCAVIGCCSMNCYTLTYICVISLVDSRVNFYIDLFLCEMVGWLTLQYRSKYFIFLFTHLCCTIDLQILWFITYRDANRHHRYAGIVHFIVLHCSIVSIVLLMSLMFTL